MRSKSEFFPDIRFHSECLFSPSRQHTERIKTKNITGVSGQAEGFRETITKQVSLLIFEKELESMARDVVVTFDGMTMRGSLILGREKENLNRIIGCTLMDENVIKKQFETFVKQISETNDKSGELFNEVDSSFNENKEHIVFYAKSLHKSADINFICATYNMPTVSAYNVSEQISEVLNGLHRHKFKVRGICADAAQAQESFSKAKANIEAKSFIPSSMLKKFDLDGEFNIAFKDRFSNEPIMIVTDPPHVLKRVASSLRNRKMEFERRQLNTQILFDAYESIQALYGNDNALLANRKLSRSHFFGSRWDAMKVKLSSQLLSGNMVSIIDTVCNHPLTYKMAKMPNTVEGRRWVFEKFGNSVIFLIDF